MIRQFCIYYWYVGWWAWSLGIAVDVRSPNIELHFPTGFVRIGWELLPSNYSRTSGPRLNKYAFGYRCANKKG